MWLFLLMSTALAGRCDRILGGPDHDGPLLREVCDHLVLRGHRPVAVKGLSAVEVPFRSARGAWSVIARVDEVEERLVLYSELHQVTPDRRAEAHALMSQANWGLVTGAFEMNPQTGQVRFRTGMELHGVSFGPELFAGLWSSHTLIAGRYRAAVVAVAGGTEAERALAAIDG